MGSGWLLTVYDEPLHADRPGRRRMTALERLQAWYFNQCDGDWEHGHGVRIETLDNPGWSLKVNLLDTDLEDRVFARIEIERTTMDWLHAWKAENEFCAACG